VSDLEEAVGRIRELERKVDLLMRHLGLEGSGAASGGSGPPHGAIEGLIREGRKIEAIKLWREATGLGLKEAKEAVEALERRLR
jgi:ribosomal protein L7/L12